MNIYAIRTHERIVYPVPFASSCAFDHTTRVVLAATAELDDSAGVGRAENYEQSLEHSMNPELQKYARETESLLAQQRQQQRHKLFSVYPDVQVRDVTANMKKPAS